MRRIRVDWLIFSYSLGPETGSTQRVAVWRRLRRMGALPLPGGVYGLPARPECEEGFAWLAEEIRSRQGEALVVRSGQIAGMDESQLIRAFHAARERDYAVLEADIQKLEKAVERRADHVGSRRLDTVRRRLADLRRIDYFDSPAGLHLETRLEALDTKLSPRPPEAEIPTLALSDYWGGRTWVTRPRPHVDRLACAWLIRRFIDADALIRFDGRPQAGEIAFDMEPAAFGHRGNLCTFEVMISSFDLKAPELEPIAQVVHQIDLDDEPVTRPEVYGLRAVFDGWVDSALDDVAIEQHGAALFDALSASLSTSRLSPRKAAASGRTRRDRVKG